MSTAPPTPDTAELQRRKLEAEIAKAEADARKADADARKAATDADSAAATARKAELTALVPDLSKVKESTLDVKDSMPMWGSFLTFGALRSVAASVVKTVLKHRPQNGEWRVLVTSEPDLATSDAAFADVSTGLDQLITAGETVRKDVDAALEAADALLSALAAALPSVLSLLSTQRTVSVGATSANDLAAASAVAGELIQKAPGTFVLHDEFRLIPSDGVYKKLADVAHERQQLVAKKLLLSDEKATAEADLSKAKAATPPDPSSIAHLTKEVSKLTARLGLVDSIIAAIDAFVATIRTTPAGAKRSLLASAALRQSLHDVQPKFDHVLLVKAQAGQVQQQLENRPLWLKDKFSAIADTSITYMLVKTEGSPIVDADTITGTASVRGNIGQAPTVDVPIVRGRT